MFNQSHAFIYFKCMLYKLFAKFIVKFQEITVDLELLQLLYACLSFFYSLNIVIAVSVVYSRFNRDNAIGFSHTLISWERPKRAKLDMLLLREIQEHSKTNYTVLDKLTNASLIKSLKCNLFFFLFKLPICQNKWIQYAFRLCLLNTTYI